MYGEKCFDYEINFWENRGILESGWVIRARDGIIFKEQKCSFRGEKKRAEETLVFILPIISRNTGSFQRESRSRSWSRASPMGWYFFHRFF